MKKVIKAIVKSKRVERLESRILELEECIMKPLYGTIDFGLLGGGYDKLMDTLRANGKDIRIEFELKHNNLIVEEIYIVKNEEETKWKR